MQERQLKAVTASYRSCRPLVRPARARQQQLFEVLTRRLLPQYSSSTKRASGDVQEVHPWAMIPAYFKENHRWAKRMQALYSEELISNIGSPLSVSARRTSTIPYVMASDHTWCRPLPIKMTVFFFTTVQCTVIRVWHILFLNDLRLYSCTDCRFRIRWRGRQFTFIFICFCASRLVCFWPISTLTSAIVLLMKSKLDTAFFFWPGIPLQEQKMRGFNAQTVIFGRNWSRSLSDSWFYTLFLFYCYIIGLSFHTYTTWF